MRMSLLTLLLLVGAVPSLGLQDKRAALRSTAKIAVEAPTVTEPAQAPAAAPETPKARSDESPQSIGEIFYAAGQKAFKGGLAGFAAGVLQVLAFMWLRTIMNRQYYHGGSLREQAAALWEEGGILRFYQGIQFAIIEAPISRFGDTFANIGVMALLLTLPIHPMVKTMFVSLVAACWRIAITPIDTFKTTMQVQGESATKLLWEKVHQGGITMLWAGALANFAANWVGNYPWWAMYNTLDSLWIAPVNAYLQIVRYGIMGMCSSITSDCISNVFRVIKTVRQADPDAEVGYMEAIQKVIKADGVLALFTRGLGTRVLTNVLQGTFFTITWKMIEKATMA